MSDFRKFFVISFSVLLGAVAFAAPSTDSSANASPAYPQEEFVANISSSIPDWRPYRAYNADEAQILTAVYEGLFVYDPWNLNPVPALAESWTVSKDNLIWTFNIRKNARFENGDKITAADIRASWLNLLDPSLQAPYASMLDPVEGAAEYRTGKNADQSKVGITAPDESTLIVKLTSPAEHLPKILCHHAFSAVHPSMLAQAVIKGTAAVKPVSSGPYRIESVTKEQIRLVKNEKYWDAANVMLPSIKLILSDDSEELTSRFNRGEINWLGGSVVVDHVLDPASVQITPMFATEYFYFRTTWGPWADSRARNALLLAIPWKDLRANYIIPAKTLVFPIAGYPEIDGINTQNIDDAKKKLAEAGIIPGPGMAPLVIKIPESETFRKLAEILKKAWEDLGLTVQITSLPPDDYYKSLKQNDYSIGVTSWIGDFADPLAFLDMFRPASSLNDSGWNSPGYEALIINASAIMQVKERYAKLAEAEKLLLADGVILPIAHNPALNVIDRNGIDGWYPNALDIHPFKFIKFVPKKPLPGVALATF